MGRYYPICLSLAGRKCLVVGGGEVACRKALVLREAGAQVTVVSPRFTRRLASLDGVRRVERPFKAADAAGALLVFAATNDAEANHQVASAARSHGALVNVVDTPGECDFIVPSTLIRGEMTIGISTGGASPALSRRLRLEIEKVVPQRYGSFVALLAKLRAQVANAVPDAAKRRAILQELARRSTWGLFAEGGADAVRQLVRRRISGQGA